MNRRKIFGILAAPAVAASIPVKSEIKTDLKPYSAFNYDDIYMLWSREYTRGKLGVPMGGYIGSFRERGYMAWYGISEIKRNGSHVDVFGNVPLVEIYQAFADACLNGEVPGVWWE